MKFEEPIKITDQAVREVQEMMSAKKVPSGYLLRVGMRGGGCGGAGFFLGFDKPQKDDETFDVNGIQVLIDKKHLMYLIDLVVNFEERTHERGFFFTKGGQV